LFFHGNPEILNVTKGQTKPQYRAIVPRQGNQSSPMQPAVAQGLMKDGLWHSAAKG
jgi:hypothetical protein